MERNKFEQIQYQTIRDLIASRVSDAEGVAVIGLALRARIIGGEEATLLAAGMGWQRTVGVVYSDAIPASAGLGG